MTRTQALMALIEQNTSYNDPELARVVADIANAAVTREKKRIALLLDQQKEIWKAQNVPTVIQEAFAKTIARIKI